MPSTIDFPEPPRITGNAASDLPVLVEYLWQFYKSAILSGGLIQNTQLSAQLQDQFLRLYNLGVLEGGAADKLPYLTGEDDWALADLTSSGRDLISKASVAAMLSFLGIVIYTLEQVQDAVATMIQNGTGITWAYDDGAGTLTPSVSITQYTDEQARDAAAAMIQDGFGIEWAEDDPGDTLTPLIRMPTYAKAALPNVATYVRCMIYVSDEVGGATPAFSDGVNWRRVSDLAIVS